METSILISKIFGLAYLTFGFGFLFNKDYYRKGFIKLLDSFPFMFYSGCIALVCGILITHYHNFWVNDWTIIITIIGWIALIKGIYLIVCPKSIKIFKDAFENKSFIYLIIVLLFLLGLVFTYLGYFQ